MENDTFWMHEDAEHEEEFGAATPEEAIERWLRYGAGTSDLDLDGYENDVCINDRVVGRHRVNYCHRLRINDADHLQALRENCDPVDTDMYDNAEVGDHYWISTQFRAFNVQMVLQIAPAVAIAHPKKGKDQ